MGVNKFLLFGDSLTFHGGAEEGGWAARLCRAYTGKADVVCRGFSGYTSRWGCEFADRVLLGHQDVGVAVIWFGANDAMLSCTGSKHFVPVDEYSENLCKLVEKVSHAQYVVLMTPPPVSESGRLEHQKAKWGDDALGYSERSQANTELYANACQKAAELCAIKLGAKVSCLDLFHGLKDCEMGLDELLSDGLHLSEAGNKKVFDLLQAHIAQKVPSWEPSQLEDLLAPYTAMSTFPGRNSVPEHGEHLAYTNCNVWEWDSFQFKSGTTILTRQGKIVSVQPNASELPQDCKVQNLNGGFVLPGLADAHIHVYHMGENLHCVDMSACTSIDDMKCKLATFSKENPDREWIMGVGWDHEKMGGVLPSRFDLDASTPAGTKVYMWRACFHIGVASTAAFEACEIPLQNPPKMENGTIDVNEDGVATGVLREGAVDLVVGHIKEPDSSVQAKYLLDGLNECLRNGLTSVQTNDIGSLPVYKELDQKGLLPIRVHLTAGLADIMTPFRSESGMLVCDRIKVFSDGALGANTAAIRNPDGTHRGILMHSQEELNQIVSTANERGFRIEAHAIGDAAAEACLDAFAHAKLSRKDRPIITHCQVLGPDLISRIASQGAIANVQPTFVPTDAAWVKERLSKDKLPYSYCWKRLIGAGIQVVGSSDCPVETCQPLKGMFDAVFRPSSHVSEPPTTDEDVFLPEERLKFHQALALYTSGAQFAACMDSRRGRLEAGFDADFTVLDRNVAVDAALLTKATVTHVVVDGSVRYSAEKDGANATPHPPRNNGPYASGKGGDPLLRCRCPRRACC